MERVAREAEMRRIEEEEKRRLAAERARREEEARLEGEKQAAIVRARAEVEAVASAERAQLGNPERDGWARASARRLSNRINRRVSGVALVSISCQVPRLAAPVISVAVSGPVEVSLAQWPSSAMSRPVSSVVPKNEGVSHRSQLPVTSCRVVASSGVGTSSTSGASQPGGPGAAAGAMAPADNRSAAPEDNRV